MYRFMSIRISVVSTLVVILLLCFLATSSLAVTIVPINGNKKIVGPGPTPYWDMGEPGGDPYGKINTLSSSGASADLVDSGREDASPAWCTFDQETNSIITKLKIMLIRKLFPSFYILSSDSIRR
jgi:hypothetical protein